MKNKSIFLISVLLITGCGVNPVNQYNNLQGPHKALAAAVNINGQKTGGSGWASGRTIYEARNNAINNCKKYNRNALCVVERENNNYVLTNSLNQLREAQTEFKIKQYQDYINTKKRLCKSYGFTEENAIARCVQQEISNEIANLKQQQIYANTQARANATQRNNALSNMGRCLSAESSFAACGNAWSGYTPKPAKKVYRCDYDVFGNQITSTCREQ